MILAPVLLVAACGGGAGGANDAANQAAGVCGREYVLYLATDVARRDFPETPGPTFSPSHASCKTLVYSQFRTPSPTQPKPILTEGVGFYTLEDMGYEDIILHSWEPRILRLLPGSAPARSARPRAEYLLPDDAAQGPRMWYVLHFHFEIEFADGVDDGRAIVYAHPNSYSTVAMSSFRPRIDGDDLVIESSGVTRAEQSGNKVEAWFTNYLPNAGVRPGLNTLSFAVRDQDGAVVQTLRVFSDSAIELTELSPAQAQATAFPPPDYSNVTPPCDREDPQCLIEQFEESRDEVEFCAVFGLDFPDCIDLINAAIAAGRPTPLPVLPVLPIYVEILFRDDAISAMVGDGVRDQDYWLRLTPATNPGHGDRPGEAASVELVFEKPVSWTGIVNTASQPCRGHGNEGHLEPNDPCLSIERVFGTVFRSYTDVRVISGTVYVRQELVANVFGSSPSPEIIEGSINDILTYPDSHRN